MQVCGRLASALSVTSSNLVLSSSGGLLSKSTLLRPDRLHKCLAFNQQSVTRFHTSKYNGKDYYKILDVPKTASQKEIKKAYYQLAKKYHPDTNKDAEAAKKFQEVSEAYECLSDDSKRRQYDTFGSSAGSAGDFDPDANNPFASGRTGFQGFHSTIDPEELFKRVFGDLGFDMFKERTSDFGFQETEFGHAASQEVHLKLTFLEAANGCTKKVDINVVDTCPKCKGSKSAEGHKPVRCPFCEGRFFFDRLIFSLLLFLINREFKTFQRYRYGDDHNWALHNAIHLQNVSRFANVYQVSVLRVPGQRQYGAA